MHKNPIANWTTLLFFYQALKQIDFCLRKYSRNSLDDEKSPSAEQILLEMTKSKETWIDFYDRSAFQI